MTKLIIALRKIFLTLLFIIISSSCSAHNEQIDYIKVIKSDRKLYTYSNNKLLKTYKIALGRRPVGNKIKQGDNRTPEGVYFISAKNPNSAYYLSLKISYPNAKDIQRANKLGVDPGGNIMIHGIKNGFSLVGKSHSLIDWTKGCIALTNAEIEEIYNLTPIGTRIDILP